MGEIKTAMKAMKCDECSAETLDYMADGWIIVKGEVTAYRGRDSNGCAQSERYINTTKEAAFCCWECFTRGRFPKVESGKYKSKTPAADALLGTPNPTQDHIRAALIELHRAWKAVKDKLSLTE